MYNLVNEQPNMPKYRKKRKYVRRRKFTRRRRKTRPRRRLVSMGVPSGMPVQRRAKLRYSQTFDLTGTSGILVGNVFRANGLHDPDFTGTGHQPMGHDQWTLLFNHYIVLGSKISVRFSASGTTGESAACGAYVSDTTTKPYADYNTYIEARKGTWRISTIQRNAISFKSFYSARKFFNIKDPRDNFARLGASTAADPAETAVFIVWMQALDKSSTAVYTATVTIDYIVEYGEPKDIAAS